MNTLCMSKNFNWDILLTLIKQRLVVPVLGTGLIFVKNSGKESISLQEHVAKAMSKKLNCDYQGEGLNSLISRNRENLLMFGLLKSTFNELSLSDLDLDPLFKLAKIFDFKYFVNTSFDGVLEETLKLVRCITESDDIQVLNHSLNPEAKPKDFGQNTLATVFNVFGNVKSKSGFARTNDEMMEYLLALQNEKVQTIKLKEAIEGKNLLFIGNEFDTWFYRFFIRILSDESLSMSETARFMVDHRDDQNFKDFNAEMKCDIYSSDSDGNNTISFINELYEKWEAFSLDYKPAEYEGSIYLCVQSEDKDAVLPLVNSLKKAGVEVVINEFEKTDFIYNEKIAEKKIKSCKLFVPVISENSLSNPVPEILKEWKMAELRHLYFEDEGEDSFIKPLVLDKELLKDERIPKSFKDNTLLNSDRNFQLRDLLLSLNRLKVK